MTTIGAPGSPTWDTVHKVKNWLGTVLVSAAMGYILACRFAGVPLMPVQPAPVPITVSPANPTKNPAHTGHFTVSYIEPRYPTPASAAVRDQLAGTDWRALDATFRAYTHGQQELTDLGFVTHYSTADLPLCFIQEAGPAGAPLVGTPLKPASAAAVLGTVKGLRGQ